MVGLSGPLLRAIDRKERSTTGETFRLPKREGIEAGPGVGDHRAYF